MEKTITKYRYLIMLTGGLIFAIGKAVHFVNGTLSFDVNDVLGGLTALGLLSSGNVAPEKVSTLEQRADEHHETIAKLEEKVESIGGQVRTLPIRHPRGHKPA